MPIFEQKKKVLDSTFFMSKKPYI